MKKNSFDWFCHYVCDNLYEPKLPYDVQSTGYNMLLKMVVNGLEPASMDEINRWETNPTQEELFSQPDIKYMRFLHPVLRPFIIELWPDIKKMELNQEQIEYAKTL